MSYKWNSNSFQFACQLLSKLIRHRLLKLCFVLVNILWLQTKYKNMALAMKMNLTHNDGKICLMSFIIGECFISVLSVRFFF